MKTTFPRFPLQRSYFGTKVSQVSCSRKRLRQFDQSSSEQIAFLMVQIRLHCRIINFIYCVILPVACDTKFLSLIQGQNGKDGRNGEPGEDGVPVSIYLVFAFFFETLILRLVLF